MPSIDFVIETDVSRSARARQLEAIFDVPPQDKARIAYKGEMPLDERPWNVGLIVGPSGCGKSSILKHVFGEGPELEWSGASVLDDFSPGLSIQAISEVCQAVGFNTIPAWLRPYRVLSNGERFRVELARRLIETPDTIVMDEFTSVVDRQVAQIGAHAVQKYARRNNRQFVGASCHYDIVEWLQPDWTLEPSTMAFTWRSLQRRPELPCEIARVPYPTWHTFAPFHYLTAGLNKAAKCFALAVNGRLAAFAGMLYRPHARVRDIWGCSRLVTLPDFQGLGLAFALLDRVASLYSACNLRTHMYPAHPALVRAFDKSPVWVMEKRAGDYSPRRGTSSTVGGFGGRPCGVFRYVGPAFEDRALARLLIA